MINEPEINAVILDELIGRSVMIEALKKNVELKLLAKLKKKLIPFIESYIADKIVSIDTSRGFSAAVNGRINSAVNKLGRHIESQMVSIVKDLDKATNRLIIDEISWIQNMTRNVMGSVVPVELTSAEAVQRKVWATPVQGMIAPEWYDNLTKQITSSVSRAVKNGLKLKNTPSQIMQSVRGHVSHNYDDGAISPIFRGIGTLNRTLNAQALNMARDQFYKDNSDIIKAVQLVATLDSRTTATCISLDGKITEVDSSLRPPFHFNCRTIAVPITKSWRELGISAEDLPEGTRASMNGQVPAKLTYPEWLRQQPHKMQDIVLGKTKAQWFRDGKLKVSQFVSSTLQPRTLKQLRQLYGL